MKTLVNFAVVVGLAGWLGACASADGADAELDFTDTEAQEDAVEPAPEPTSEQEIAPTRDWAACQEAALRGIECVREDVLSEDDAPAAAGLDDEVQPSSSERWQTSWQSP